MFQNMPKSKKTEEKPSDDEWEEITMIAEVNGVLDADVLRKSVASGHVALRRTNTDKPILQIGNSLYNGKWTRTIGTDIILESDSGQLKVLSATDKMLKTEKALLTAAGSSSNTNQDDN